ncbi:MAG TPA: glycosyltransferase family 2 protein [Paludibacteraceae bacterium]|nr:glycosyltransferase family 2 protein [Paludibacteraceae bacterium]
MSFFTLITINYNHADGLRKTIESVINQTYQDFQYIIIDGGSTDGSVEVIKEYADHIHYWISEPDNGIYHAMNKGISHSTADFLLFINSGDKLFDSTVLEKTVSSLNPNTEIASGKIQLIANEKKTILSPPSVLSLYQSLYNSLTHPNTFIRRSLFEKYGYYNEQNKIVSDWEFFLRATGLNDCRYQTLDFVVSEFYEDGVSSLNHQLAENETNVVINQLIPNAIQKDIQRLFQLETLMVEPAYLVLQRYSWVKNILRWIYKINKKLNKFTHKTN